MCGSIGQGLENGFFNILYLITKLTKYRSASRPAERDPKSIWQEENEYENRRIEFNDLDTGGL